MRISFVGAFERVVPGSLQARTLPIATALDDILYGKDDRSVSRRIAIITFAVRIVSAVIAYVSQVLLARWMGDFEYGVFVIVGSSCLGALAGPEKSEKEAAPCPSNTS